MAKDIPTLYDWAGGIDALNRLTETLYDRVLKDPTLEPVFRHMSGDHPKHVAAFLGEVFGGPKTYSEQHGGHPAMITHHLNRHLTEEQRRRWIALLIDAADAVGLPDDPEFRSAFVAYIEWGTRLARLNSQDGAAPTLDEPMPQWGWGVPGGPYQPQQ
ncbi:MAG: group II truncated hemoglobin [Rhizobiaceae bacterium]